MPKIVLNFKMVGFPASVWGIRPLCYDEMLFYKKIVSSSNQHSIKNTFANLKLI